MKQPVYPTKKIEEIELPFTSPGTKRSLKVLRYGERNTGGKVYIQAGLHADEPPGFVTMHYLIRMLDEVDRQNKIVGEIVVVPVANPIGLSQWRDETLQGRFELFDRINFNRNYPDVKDEVARQIKGKLKKSPEKNVGLIRKEIIRVIHGRKVGSEAESLKKTLMSLSADADIVLDLHCDYDAVLHIYMGTPLWPDASDLAAQMGARAILLAKNSGGEPFDEACSKIWWELAEEFPDYPIPSACLSATVELRGSTSVSHEFGQHDARNLFLFLKRRGYIKGKAPKLPRLFKQATPLAGVEHVKAHVPGIVVYRKSIGESVKKGDIIADIIDPLGDRSSDRIHYLKCNSDGVLFTKNVDRYAKPGRILAKIAGKIPLQGKGEHLLTA